MQCAAYIIMVLSLLLPVHLHWHSFCTKIITRVKMNYLTLSLQSAAVPAQLAAEKLEPAQLAAEKLEPAHLEPAYQEPAYQRSFQRRVAVAHNKEGVQQFLLHVHTRTKFTHVNTQIHENLHAQHNQKEHIHS